MGNVRWKLLVGVVFSLALFSLAQVTIQLGWAEDQAGSRSVTLTRPGGRKLAINQIETSKFPNVDIFALVTENDQPVVGLTSSDFRVREDEVDQEPVKVDPEIVPLSVVLAVDTSGSMSKSMAKVREAAQTFVDSLVGNDSVGVVGFSRTVQVIAPFGSQRGVAKSAISTLQARGDTALYDALYSSLESAKTKSGRRAVILLSDGVDDDGTGKQLSRHSLEDVITLAKQLNVPVFTIGLGNEIDQSILSRVASESGGDYFAAPTAEDLAALYGKLGKQLTGQYHISYTSNLPADGSVHTIQLTQLSLRATKEYTSPSQAGFTVKPPSPAPVAQVDHAPSPDLVGGAGPESAPVITPNQTVRVRCHKEGDKCATKFFVAIDLDSASAAVASAVVTSVTGAADCPQMNWVNPQMNEFDGVFHCGPPGTVIVQAVTRAEREGRWYLAFSNTSEASLGVYLTKVDDAGNGKDAGASESKALNLSAGQPITGHLASDFDEEDAYRVQLDGGVEYQIRVRPDLTGAVELQLYDEDGNQVGTEASRNAGAGATLSYTPKSSMNGLIAVRKNVWSSRGIHQYALVYGPKGVAAPSQPEEVTVKQPK